MGARPAVRQATWTERWWKSQGRLPAARQASCDRVVMLIEGQDLPGIRVKPIQPDKHYSEARVSSGDRIVFRGEGSGLCFVDIVSHDDISGAGPADAPQHIESQGSTRDGQPELVRGMAG